MPRPVPVASPPSTERSEAPGSDAEKSENSETSSVDTSSTSSEGSVQSEKIRAANVAVFDKDTAGAGGENFRAIASRLRGLVVPEPEPSVLREDKCRSLASRLQNLAVEEPEPSVLREPVAPPAPKDPDDAVSLLPSAVITNYACGCTRVLSFLLQEHLLFEGLQWTAA